jgi:hypothetical protein
VIFSKGFLIYRQCPLVKRLRLGVFGLKSVDFSQIVQGCRKVRMLWPKGLFPYCQRSFKKRLGFSILALELIK